MLMRNLLSFSGRRELANKVCASILAVPGTQRIDYSDVNYAPLQQMPSALRVTGATGPHEKHINGIYVHDGFQNQVSAVVSQHLSTRPDSLCCARAQTKLYRKYDSNNWWV